jgi:ribosome modulation factor
MPSSTLRCASIWCGSVCGAAPISWEAMAAERWRIWSGGRAVACGRLTSTSPGSNERTCFRVSTRRPQWLGGWQRVGCGSLSGGGSPVAAAFHVVPLWIYFFLLHVHLYGFDTYGESTCTTFFFTSMVIRAVAPLSHQNLNPIFNILISHKSGISFPWETTFPSIARRICVSV